MPAISTEDRAILAMPLHATRKLTVCIWKRSILATAEIDGNPDWSEPVASFAITNVTDVNGDWDESVRGVGRGTLIQIWDSTLTTLKYEGAARGASLTVLRTAGMREGETGTARERAGTIGDGDIVIGFDAHIPFTFQGRAELVGETVVLKKFWDQDYEGQTEYPEPHPRMGRNLLIEIAPGEEASITFVDDSHDFKGDTLERTWRPPSGWAQTAGTNETETATYDVPAGQWMMAMTARRNPSPLSSDASLGFRRIFVTDGPDGDYPAFSDLFHIEQIPRDEQDIDGRTITLVVSRTRASDDDIHDYLYYGAFVLMQETPAFTDDDWQTVNVPSAGFVDQFAGYIRRFERIETAKDAIETWSVVVESPLLFFDALRIPSQSLMANDPPGSWYEASSALMRPDFWIYMVIWYHANNIARWHDFYLEDLDEFALPSVSWNVGTLGAAVREMASRVAGGTVGCLSDGTLLAKRDPTYEGSAFRVANPTTITLYDDDIEDGVEADRDPAQKVGRTTGTAVVSSTSEVPALIEAEAGYLAPGQGPGNATLPGFIALSSNDARDRVGHHHALQNMPIQPVPFDLTGNLDVIEPVRREWVRVDLENYAPLNPEVFEIGARWLAERIVRSWEFAETGIEKRITVVARPETEGWRAPLVPPPTIGSHFVPPVVTRWCHFSDFTADDDSPNWITTDADTAYFAASGWGSSSGSGTVVINTGTIDDDFGKIKNIYFSWNIPTAIAGQAKVLIGYTGSGYSSEIGSAEAGVTNLTLNGLSIPTYGTTPLTIYLSFNVNAFDEGDQEDFRITSARVGGTGPNNPMGENC